MQVGIINGIYSDSAADLRAGYPRNRIPVPMQSGVSNGYLRPAHGIEQLGNGPGVDRGGIYWQGALYRVMGTSLVRIDESSTVTTVGTVAAGGQAAFDYSFDRLAIAAGGSFYYWDGATLSQVTDIDLGPVLSFCWLAGYFVTTDGTNLIQTDLNNPASVQVTNYGSAEIDPDPIKAVDRLRNELYALGRFSVEVFQNQGGDGFVFQRIDGAQITKGIVGSDAYCSLGDTFMFLGSGRGEALGVYQMVPGNVQKVSTREIDQILTGYTEEQLASAVMESRVDKNHQHVYIHLPDQCLVYDTIGSQAFQQPIWFTLTSSVIGAGTYRARNMVWAFGRWNVGDPTSTAFGALVEDVSTHYGQPVGWEFGTMMLYNEGNGAIVHELELITLPGRVALGADPVVWTQYSTDGQTWSMERAARAGKQGERNKRLCWRGLGVMRQWRVQRFRGTSDSHLTALRLEAQVEPLFTKGYSNA